MMKSLKRFIINLRLSVLSLGKLYYRQPLYILLALVVGLMFYQIIFWFLNLGLAHYLFTNPYLTIGDKLSLVWSSFAGVFQPPIATLSVLLLSVSLLQGVAISALVYSFRSNRKFHSGSKRVVGGVGAAGLLSVVGLGCAACGTSLVTPLLTLFTASASTALADQIGFYSAVLALALTLITLYTIGRRLHVNLMLEDTSN